jgi:acyl carrier protein
MPEARLLNLYGSSEVAADVTCYDTRVGGLRQGVQGLPIGRPIDNTQIYLLDRYGQIVPVGIPGDLYVGGAGLARGYRGQPQLTAESFVPNPFAKPGRAERLYRMGDRARYLSEGTLEYLGRQDFQVKIRGFRVELGEVEAALRACPDVGQALVVARAETTGDNQLVAYLVPQNQTVEPAKLDIGAIRRCVMQKLPAYMVPALYVPLAMFPLTASGKVNRRALPPPEAATYRSETVYVAPRTATEETLVSIWGDVLELSPAGIGVYDNFGDLGGHSLRAVQVMNRIQEQLLVSLPFDQLFVQQTVAALAERVEIELLAQQGDEEMLQLLAEFGETSELGTDKEGNGR